MGLRFISKFLLSFLWILYYMLSCCVLEGYPVSKKELEYRISLAEALYDLGLYQKAGYEVKDLMKLAGDDVRVKRLVKLLKGKVVLDRTQGKDKRTKMRKELLRVSKKSVDSDKINIYGKVRLAVGLDSQGNILWKSTNPDKDSVPYEKSWRYLWGQDRENTFDPKIYSRLELNIATKKSYAPNLFTQLVLDPWSYVGTIDAHITSTTGTDQADVRLKYIFATGKTMNETFRTDLGNILNIDEIKVVDGQLSNYTPTGLYDWWTYFNSIGGQKVQGRWNIVRKLWLDYRAEAWMMKVFFLSDQGEALSSDDPLRISNNHKDWEESPWIDTYEPSRIFFRSGNPVKAGRWVRNISAYVRDSDWNRLTYLRGMSWGLDLGDVQGNFVFAVPMTLWDDYNDFSSAESATRWKFFFDRENDVYIGLTGTMKLGFDDSKDLEAQNYVMALDGGFSLNQWLVQGEMAYSTTEVDEANGYKNDYHGYGYKVQVKNSKGIGWIRYCNVFASYMDRGFSPGLSNYRYTRKEQERTKHIYFDDKNSNQESLWLDYGDGIDKDRIALGAYLRLSKAGYYADLFGRNVHSSNGSYIESLLRAELGGSILPNLEIKLLGWYKFLPKTTAGKDPLISADNIYALTDYYSGDSEMMENADIEAGKDPSIGHFSVGLRYKFFKGLSVQGIVERTNDIGDFPRLLFSDTYVSDMWDDGVLWDRLVPFLYDQDIFGLPPYPYYHILRFKLSYAPWQWLDMNFSYTRNDNKFATGIDDNVNHFGFELRYKPKNGLVIMFSYVYSQLYDLYEYNQNGVLDFKGHNNFFLGVDWELSENSGLEFMWGEYGPFLEDKDYWYCSALDTQHLFRIVYKRKF